MRKIREREVAHYLNIGDEHKRWREIKATDICPDYKFSGNWFGGGKYIFHFPCQWKGKIINNEDELREEVRRLNGRVKKTEEKYYNSLQFVKDILNALLNEPGIREAIERGREKVLAKKEKKARIEKIKSYIARNERCRGLVKEILSEKGKFLFRLKLKMNCLLRKVWEDIKKDIEDLDPKDLDL